MKPICAALLTLVASAPALAQEAPHRLGEHPAVIVKRLVPKQGYDYASKFYPHPAWLYWSTEAPRPMMDHPAVIVFRRHQREVEKQRQAALRPSTAVLPGG